MFYIYIYAYTSRSVHGNAENSVSSAKDLHSLSALVHFMLLEKLDFISPEAILIGDLNWGKCPWETLGNSGKKHWKTLENHGKL